MNTPTKILKVFHYGESEEENKVVTIAPLSIRMVVADPLPTVRQGKATKRTVVIFEGNEMDELFLSDLDLETIETVVGTYSFEY